MNFTDSYYNEDDPGSYALDSSIGSPEQIQEQLDIYGHNGIVEYRNGALHINLKDTYAQLEIHMKPLYSESLSRYIQEENYAIIINNNNYPIDSLEPTSHNISYEHNYTCPRPKIRIPVCGCQVYNMQDFMDIDYIPVGAAFAGPYRTITFERKTTVPQEEDDDSIEDVLVIYFDNSRWYGTKVNVLNSDMNGLEWFETCFLNIYDCDCYDMEIYELNDDLYPWGDDSYYRK